MRGQRIALRWANIAALAIVGAAIVVAGALVWLGPLLTRKTPSVLFVIVGLLLLACIVGHRGLSHWRSFNDAIPVSAWTRLSAFLGLRHFGRYPPVWLAAVFGFGLAMLVLSLAPREFGLASGYEWLLRILATASGGLALAVGLASAAIDLYERLEKPNVQEPALNVVPIYENLDAFRTWILGDDAVRQPSDDMFGHSKISLRIAQRIAKSGTSDQSIVGPYGSGKTGVLFLTQWFLWKSRSTHVEVVKVDLWPYETPRAAVEGVIRHLITAIGRHVDTYAVQKLPKEYSKLAGAAADFGALITGHLDESSPAELLERIDRIIGAIGIRFVLWLEDMERFAPAKRGNAIEFEDSERLNPLRALLHRLSQSKSVVVVEATTAAHSRFDREKISRYIEEIPAIEPAEARRLLAAFFSLCQERDYIEAASASVVRDWEEVLKGRSGRRWVIAGNPFPNLQAAAIAMCRNPRTLKVAFRSTLEMWGVLAGEIDLRDLLLLNLFREFSPVAFAVLRDARDDLSPRWTFPEKLDKARKKFATDLDEKNVSATAQQIAKLFVEQLLVRNLDRPQGIWHDLYWQRYISQPLNIDQSVSDQGVLRAIRSEDNDALVELLGDHRGDLVVQFARHLSPERALSLLVPVTQRRVGESPTTWPADVFGPRPPGIVPIWQLWGEVKPPAGSMAKEVEAALSIAVDNLALASDIEYFFLSTNSETPLIRIDGYRELIGTIRDTFWAAFAQRFQDAPVGLAKALKHSRTWTLARLVWGSARSEAKSFDGVPFEGWESLASTILQAIEVDRPMMLSQISCLITVESGTKLSGPTPETVFRFDEDLCRRLFDDVDAVLGLYEDNFDPLEGSEGRVKAIRKFIAERKG